ncbi:MAG: Holliday junction branch migration protein RuvA [Rectinemataceae bacterium]|jgi:Holliday junction DNA helicase RuvA
MFNSINGRLSEKRADTICIETGGVEWELAVPARSVDDFGRIGDEARAFTWLHHYEDGMRIYGFPSEADRAAFRELMKVEGIGPKQAMRILSGIRPEALGAALDAEDLASLQRIPGVGPKLAQKIMLSLKGKLVSGSEAGAKGGRGTAGEWADVVRALADMGFDRKTAEKAVAEAAKKAASVKPAAGTAGSGEREREIFRSALLDLSSGA